MANNVDYSFDGRFEGNIFIVGQSGCEKQLLYKTWQKMECLKILKKVLGIKNISFLGKRKKYKLFSKNMLILNTQIA